jgi:hypothetical protein
MLEADDLDPREELRAAAAAQQQELDQALCEMDEDGPRDRRARLGQMVG